MDPSEWLLCLTAILSVLIGKDFFLLLPNHTAAATVRDIYVFPLCVIIATYA